MLRQRHDLSQDERRDWRPAQQLLDMRVGIGEIAATAA